LLNLIESRSSRLPTGLPVTPEVTPLSHVA
jgi:hypothetical protein